MRTLSPVFAALLLGACAVNPARPPAEQAVLAAEQAFADAMTAHDPAAIARVVAPDWISGSESGKLSTRAGFIAQLSSGELVISRLRNHDLRVQVLGDLALVQGLDDETTTLKGQDVSGTRSWLDVWARREGRWVLIASHEATVVKPRAAQQG